MKRRLCVLCYAALPPEKVRSHLLERVIAAIVGAQNAVSGMLAWGTVGAVLLAWFICALGILGGLYALDHAFGEWLASLHPDAGNYWFWGPKIIVAGLVLLPPIFITRWLLNRTRSAAST